MSTDKNQGIPQIKPFPGQTEQEQDSKFIDFDDYLRDPETFFTTVLLFFVVLVFELALIGYFSFYLIYGDRSDHLKDSRKIQRKEPRRIVKKFRKKRRANKTTF